MSRKKEVPTVIVGPPAPPVVERLPERYQLNTIMTRFGFAGEPFAPAVLNRAEAEELFEGLIEALFPLEVINGEA